MAPDAGVERGQDASNPLPSSESMQPASQQQQEQHYPVQYHHPGSERHQQEGRRDGARAQASPLPPIQQGYEAQTAMQQPHYAAAQLQQHSYASANQYHYPQNGAMQPAPMPSNGQSGLMRYAIPPQAPLDSRSMSGVRGKKEIKRRTKTGCLTCRKRRIKCDENQPHCRNCAKSKRECLGYDPIFKAQSGPAAIQPAPAAASSGTPDTKASATPTLPSNPYQAHSYPGTGGTFVPAGGNDATFESYTSLDPALNSGVQLAMARTGYPSNLQQERKVKFMRIDDLFSLNDVPPLYEKREAPPPITPAIRQEVADFYTFHFAPGLDRLFETQWYTTQGLGKVQVNAVLEDFVAQCAEQFKASADNPSAAGQIRSLEARLVWQLAMMPRWHASDEDLIARIDTLENLLTGQYLEPDKLPPPPKQDMTPPLYNELAFWHHLGRFTAARDDRADPAATNQINDSLGAMRGILNMLENRDVLYSIAIARHIGGRMPEFHPHRHLISSTNDPQDDVNKLKVAHKFVETENDKGTTQVIQRICSMALRGWVLQKQ